MVAVEQGIKGKTTSVQSGTLTTYWSIKNVIYPVFSVYMGVSIQLIVL
jgi:hypothetical protein